MINVFQEKKHVVPIRKQNLPTLKITKMLRTINLVVLKCLNGCHCLSWAFYL